MRNGLVWTILLSGLAIWNCDGIFAAAEEGDSRTTPNVSPKQRSENEKPMRTFMMVEYDYRLEANTTKITDSNTTEDSERNDNIFSEKERNEAPLESALLDIDTDIIPYLQEHIPGGDIPEDGTMPDVEYTTVNSRFINMCFTESDACKFVKSRIKLSYVENLPKASMERITLDLVRDYLSEFNEENPSVNTMFVYPMIYSSTVQLNLSPVDGPMSDGDIEHLVTTFHNVYQAIVSALDGDTELSEVFFVYQDVGELKDSNEQSNRRLGEEETSQQYELMVNLKYFGKCRYCTEDDLAATIHQTFEPNQHALLANLKKTGSETDATYFQNVTEVSFSVYTPPDVLPPDINAATTRDVGVASKKIPWLLYIGVAAAVFVLGTGVYVIVKDQKKLRSKEEASTGDESNNDDSEKAESAESGDGGDPNSNASSSSSLNTNTLNQTGMHSDYEVYVY